jgi:hypothetical protein
MHSSWRNAGRPGYKGTGMLTSGSAVKRWYIFFCRSQEERLAGRSFARPRPRH